MKTHKKLYRVALLIPLLFCFLSAFSPTTLAQNTLDDGLVGYWNFDEGSGVIAIDSSGNNNHANINGAAFTSGIYQTSLNFSGDDYLTLPSLTYQNFSISMWIKPTSNLAEFSYIRLFSQTDNNFEIAINAGTINYYYGSTWEDIQYTPSYEDYTLLQTTYDGTTITTYINGTETDNFIGGRPLVGNSYIGMVWFSDSYYTGSIDDLRIYNRCLSSIECLQIFEFNPDFVEPTTTPTPIPDNFSINYLNSFALIILAIICIFLTIKPNVPILNFIFGIIVLGISAATAGQSDMLLWGYMPLLTVILAIVCMLSGYVSWKR